MKNLKLIIGVALAVIWGAIFLVMPATAAESTDVNGANSADHQAKMDAKGRSVATFGMNFSASSNVEGDFMHNGMVQNLFGGESKDRPYYYQK
jgi:predicted lipoprotein with Yx(FWY)xxD motif